MAEGLARELGRGVLEPYSAGLMATGVHPRAIAVMKEIGIDISGQNSKTFDERLLTSMDWIVTLCDDAADACPVKPEKIKRLHWPIKDPVKARVQKRRPCRSFAGSGTRSREKSRIS